MVRLTKIYTRTGDGGDTRLVGGQQVPKDSLRIEAYGTVDELNTVLGLVRAALAERETTLGAEDREPLLRWIHGVQQCLFNLGSDLATLVEDRWEGQPLIQPEDITALEETIDRWNASLEPLKSFVLPGGSLAVAHLHQARTVCRRAERRVLTLAHAEPVGELVVPYLNRLSDALFVASRWVALRAGEAEVLWEY
ncbi:MAG: cob(I)yrinic acid a,c-diamide adenosyltransferase [Deltaproteobacteria bacterium]|nr:cob(I)yrinic acid a,c-diamide adenosyltransferase [Deltaproteobacteria bacterium]MCB9786388.1 cob(I)yrinic acid a,c-diamide adenosyltransferase [Deltaproteobacteria bacterium]